MDAQQGRIEGLRAGFAHFKMPDIGGHRGKAHRGVDVAVGVERGLAQGVEAETAATLPSHGFADAALLAVDDFLQARDAVGAGVLAHFDADPAAAHLVGHGGCGARAKEGVENEVAGVGGDVDDAMEKALWFGAVEGCHLAKKRVDFLFRLVRMPDLIGWPPSPWRNPRYFRQIPNYVRLRAAVFAKINAPLRK
ncbi:hypothetical protein GALL_321300 [mine drainage metagenome]|uniref:Uncharacterized protein n=1 Tax=mine drainage metagenome TaxID=410659 RepID=A0A1J5QRJ1_9ZZZZ